jgi:hypothetical protein
MGNDKRKNMFWRAVSLLALLWLRKQTERKIWVRGDGKEGGGGDKVDGL